MQIELFHDTSTATFSYVVFDEQTGDALVIDPVMDYDLPSSTVSRESVDRIEALLRRKNLKLHMILETHAHADHMSGAQFLKDSHPDAILAIGEKITEVQKLFRPVFNLSNDFPVDGSQFDRLLSDGETVQAGSIEFRVIATPGHTPACSSYLIGDALFAGDTIFMPDLGTGRCDFPAGSAERLYHSIRDGIYSLPDETRIFVGHDYPPEGRDVQGETTVGIQKQANKQLPAGRTLEQFVKFRTERDATLRTPKLLFSAVQVNIAAGQIPHTSAAGEPFLKMPVHGLPKLRSTPIRDRDPKLAVDLVDDGALLLDVRSDQEFQEGHIPGALHIPHDQVADRILELPACTQTIVVYCRAGGRAEMAKAVLVERGFCRVMNLGGIDDWPKSI